VALVCSSIEREGRERHCARHARGRGFCPHADLRRRHRPKKKPDPAIYNLAATTLGVDPARCIVIEDSHIGLTAAKAAGMTCVVTTSGYTEKEDFAKADAVFPEIRDSLNRM